MAINAEETVRIYARPVDWEGEIDPNATVQITVLFGGETSEPVTLIWVALNQAFRGEYTFPEKGVYEVRVKATLSDGSVARHTRRIEVRP